MSARVVGQVLKASSTVHGGGTKSSTWCTDNHPACRPQVVKASSKVHGGGTEYKLQLEVSQGDETTSLEVRC